MKGSARCAALRRFARPHRGLVDSCGYRDRQLSSTDEGKRVVNAVERSFRRFDRYQQQHPALAVPIAVLQKFGNDQAGGKAALIAYYGLFALFPMLLLMATVLGFVLSGHPALQAHLLNSALANFPIISAQLQNDTHALKGSGIALVVGRTRHAVWRAGTRPSGRQRDEHDLERALQVVAELLRTPAARVFLARRPRTCQRWRNDVGRLRYVPGCMVRSGGSGRWRCRSS